MHTDVVNGLHFNYMSTTDTIQLWVHGRRVKRYDPEQGSRRFFKVGSYFIKAEYAYPRANTQCKDEAFLYGKLDLCDKQFFPKLLACSDMGEDMVQWVMYPWYNLTPHWDAESELFKRCSAKVHRLCDKYGIGDVAPYVNINWFIHKSRPLIVDCGCAGDY